MYTQNVYTKGTLVLRQYFRYNFIFGYHNQIKIIKNNTSTVTILHNEELYPVSDHYLYCVL